MTILLQHSNSPGAPVCAGRHHAAQLFVKHQGAFFAFLVFLAARHSGVSAISRRRVIVVRLNHFAHFIADRAR